MTQLASERKQSVIRLTVRQHSLVASSSAYSEASSGPSSTQVLQRHAAYIVSPPRGRVGSRTLTPSVGRLANGAVTRRVAPRRSGARPVLVSHIPHAIPRVHNRGRHVHVRSDGAVVWDPFDFEINVTSCHSLFLLLLLFTINRIR